MSRLLPMTLMLDVTDEFGALTVATTSSLLIGPHQIVLSTDPDARRMQFASLRRAIDQLGATTPPGAPTVTDPAPSAHLPGCAADTYPDPGMCFCDEREAFARKHNLCQEDADQIMEDQESRR